MRPTHNLRFILICAALLAVGGLVRYYTGWLVLPWSQPSQPSALAASAGAPVSPELRATVLDFYNDLDRGQCQAAYALALENQWQREGDAYTSSGLTSEPDFIVACTAEMGDNGSDMSIVNFDVLNAQPLPVDQRDAAHWPALATLDHLPTEAQVADLYAVEVGGAMLEHCAPADFHKTMLVANISGLGWRILLPGSPGPESTHLVEWFQPIDVWAGRQIITSGGTPK